MMVLLVDLIFNLLIPCFFLFQVVWHFDLLPLFYQFLLQFPFLYFRQLYRLVWQLFYYR